MSHNPQVVGLQSSPKLIKFMKFLIIVATLIWAIRVIINLPRSQPEPRGVASPPPPPAYITLRRGEEIQLQIRECEWTPWLILPEEFDFNLQLEKQSNGTLQFGFPNGVIIRSPARNPELGKLPGRKFRIAGINGIAKFLVFP